MDDKDKRIKELEAKLKKKNIKLSLQYKENDKLKKQLAAEKALADRRFIGDPPPVGAQFLANEDGEFNGNEWKGSLSGEEQAMIDAAWEKHKSALTESPYLAR